MFRHLFELCSRTTVISIRINGNTTTWSKDSGYFNVFGIHQLYQIFHYNIHTIFMKGSMITETEKIEFQALAFYHFYIGNVADTYFRKVRLSGNRTQTCELRAVETYPIIIFRMLIIKGFQYFRSIILLILGFFFPIRKAGLLIQSLHLLVTSSTLNKKRIFSITYHHQASNALFIDISVVNDSFYNLSPHLSPITINSQPTFALSSSYLLRCVSRHETECFTLENR